MNTAKLTWAEHEALMLMGRHGLSGWQFRFNRLKRRCGLCHFPVDGNPGVIELSIYFVELNDEPDIRDTILHEVAHALAGERGDYHHGAIWKKMARLVGAKPTACSSQKRMPGAWQATCGGCGRTHTLFRKPTVLEHYCLACGPVKGRVTFAKA